MAGDQKQPVDRSVFIKRRIYVLIVLLAVVAAVVLIIVKPGAGSVAEGEQVDVPSDLGTQTDPDAPQTCTPGQLEVTALTSEDTYRKGEVPMLSLRVENTGDADCVANLGTSNMEFVLTSGSDEVWRSTDCQKHADDLPVILAPKKPLETEAFEWDRTRSNPDTCEGVRETVSLDGSTYHLTVKVAGAESADSARFMLY